MSDNACLCQLGYILRQRHYRESSLILDFFTREYGRISVLAKGVRKSKSRLSGLLRPFNTLLISFVGKSNLKTLTHAEVVDKPSELNGFALFGGFYLNELICGFLHKDDPHPSVFDEYHDCIIQMSENGLTEAMLRDFELSLMENAGYGLQLDFDLQHEKPVEADKMYMFNKECGIVEDRDGPFFGFALKAIANRQFQDPAVLQQAKALLRIAIDHRLQDHPLKTRTVLNDIVKRL